MPILPAVLTGLPSPPVVMAESVSWQSPTGQQVLARVTLAVAREKTGLVGANGSGKTTLARILSGELAPTNGAVSRSGIVARLPQDFAPLAEASVGHALGIEAKLDSLRRLSAGQGLPGDLAVLDDDWSLEARTSAVLHKLGLDHVSLDRPMGTLSGGETTRIVLASLFLKLPDLIILDEPTNNLDQQSRHALHDSIRDWTGAMLIVSHDRQLLGLMDRIVELSPRGLRSYGGNFDLYTVQRDAEAAAAQRDLQHAAKELRKTRRDAQSARERQERRSSRGKKSRDKGGLGGIELNTRRDSSQKTTAHLADTFEARIIGGQDALAAAQARVDERLELDISLSPVDMPSGKTVLELNDVSFRYANGKPILKGLNLRVVGPERLAIVGANGSGKSTLLKLVLGELQPTTGRVRLGVSRVNCLDQRAELLDQRRTVLENFRVWNPSLPETVCRQTLARFLFRSEGVHQPSATLSGGERLRAALACTLTGIDPPHLLLLDEPTNHLDLSSLANLEAALRLYTGALIVVSHDRIFLENIGIHRTVELIPT